MGVSHHATVMPDGDLRLPVEVREQLDLQPGEEIELRVEAGRSVLLKSRSQASSLAGMLKSSVSGVTLEDMQRAIEDGALGR